MTLPTIQTINNLDVQRELEEVMLNLLNEVVEDGKSGLIARYNESGSNLSGYFATNYSVFPRQFIEEFAPQENFFITFIRDGRVPFNPPRDVNCKSVDIVFAVYVSVKGKGQQELQDMRRIADDIKAIITTKSQNKPYSVNLAAESFSDRTYFTNFNNNVAGGTIFEAESVPEVGNVATATFSVKMSFFW